MVAEGLTARTVNTYLSLLGTIVNPAVDDDGAVHGPGRLRITRAISWPVDCQPS